MKALLAGAVLFLFAMAAPGRAQISYTTVNVPYNQNFTLLPSSGSVTWTDNSTLPGWYAFRAVPNAPAVTCTADNGSLAPTGVVYSYGPTGSTDRAISMLPGSTPGDCMVGVRFTNNTGKTLTSFVAGYSGEQWRVASTVPRSIVFAYKIGTTSSLNDNTTPWTPWAPLNFTSPITSATAGPLDGNAAANRSAGISSIVTGISWPPGTDLWIRFSFPWLGTNQGLAVDSFNFYASDDPNEALYREAINTVTTVDNQIAAAGAGLKVRDLSMAAYICLALNYPDPTTAVTKAKSYLTAMFTKQNTTVGSASYGHLYWAYTDSAVTDYNSTEFCLMPLGVILKRYSAALGTTYISSITAQTQNALNAARAYSVLASYTNIYTMRAENLLLVGEALGDTVSQAAGATAIDSWIADLGTEFIHEYDSPTYTPVTLINLMAIANNTANVVAADKCRALLDLVAADACANYFPGQAKMGGSHSRDYDFTMGWGDMPNYYYVEGLRSEDPAYVVKGSGVEFYLNLIEKGYRTPADILAYGDPAQWPTRIIKSLWGPATTPGMDRYDYMTPDFMIGSSGTNYATDAPLDKAIAADFTSANWLGQVSVVYDPYDLPYGTVSSISGTGETVVAHLKFAGAIVQDHGTILSLANLSPEWNALGPYTNLSASVVFPIGVSNIYLNGTQITASGTYPASLNSVIAVRQGNAVVAARFFLVDGVKGYTPTFAVKFDDPTGATGRMVAYIYNGASTTFDSTYQPRIGTVVAAQTCTSDAAAASFIAAVQGATIAPATSGTQWTASVTLNGTTLAAGQDTSNNAILYRTVNGAAYVPAGFTVNNGSSTTVDLKGKLLGGMIGSGWVLADIGSLPSPSTASYNAAAATTSVTSISGDYWNNADAGSFTYRPLTGDCDVVARVDSQTAAHPWSKAGVMVRESLAAGSKCALSYITPGNGARFSYRAATDGACARTGVAGAAPCYVRIKRVGDTFLSYYGTDGITWTQMGVTETIPMNQTVYVGFAVCSCIATASTTAVFSHTSVH